MVPALFIQSKDGKYIFFGNGIQIHNIEQEYERLKMAVRYVKEVKKGKISAKKGNAGVLEEIMKQIPNIPVPHVQISFSKLGTKKKSDSEKITEIIDPENNDMD